MRRPAAGRCGHVAFDELHVLVLNVYLVPSASTLRKASASGRCAPRCAPAEGGLTPPDPAPRSCARPSRLGLGGGSAQLPTSPRGPRRDPAAPPPTPSVTSWGGFVPSILRQRRVLACSVPWSSFRPLRPAVTRPHLMGRTRPLSCLQHHTCTCTQAHIHMHASMHTHAHTRVHTHATTCTHSCTYTHA